MTSLAETHIGAREDRLRTIFFGTAALFSAATFVFGSVGTGLGILRGVPAILFAVLLILAVHAFALLLASVSLSPSNAIAFLLASLMEITAVLASWTGELFSPALFLLVALVLYAAYVFGRRGALLGTLGAASVVGLLGGFEPSVGLSSSLGLLSLGLVSTAFGATIEEGMDSERKFRAAHESARRSERAVALSVLSAGFAHEVKNPVAGLLAFLANWQGEAKDSKTRERLATIEGELQRTLGLIRRAEAWQVARSEAPARIDLARMADETLELLAAERQEHNIRLSGLREPAYVKGIEGTLRQAVLNLLLNAVSFAGPGGEIRVEVGREGEEWVRILVEDTGPGIPPEDRERIFEPFYTTRSEGTGMGLAVARCVVEEAGGKVVAGSAPLGGARFEIRLPAAAPVAPAAAPVAPVARA